MQSSLPFVSLHPFNANCLNVGTHYPCSRAHGPWTRASFSETREHGPSRSAAAIVNDVTIIFYLQDACNSSHGLPTRPVNTDRVHGCPKWHPCSFDGHPRPVNTGSVYRPLASSDVNKVTTNESHCPSNEGTKTKWCLIDIRQRALPISIIMQLAYYSNA